MKTIKQSRLTMTFLFCLLITIGLGQDNELTKRVVNKILNETQQNFLTKITNRETTKRHEIIELNLDVLKSTSITLTLFDGQTITINKEIKKTKGTGGYSWKGSSPDKRAKLILVVNGNEAMGSLMLNNKAYRLESLGDGTYVLIELDQSKFDPEGCYFDENKNNKDGGNGNSNKQGGFGFSVLSHTPGCDLRLLVAYTPAAAGQVANILNLIELAVEETNDSYDNSNINHEVELAHVVAVNYTESNDKNTDIDRFANGGDGFMDEIHQLRTLYSADVCVLIVDNSNYNVIVCGTAKTVHSGNNPNEAFCLVDWDCATGNFSFGHEIGHLQGARHDNDPSDTPFEWGHGYEDPNGNWRTIMATANLNIPRIQFWSNPNVNHPVDGTPMGTAADNDNARVLNATTPQMLNYRVPSENITISNVTIPNMGFADLLAVNTIEVTNFTVEAGAVVNLVAGDQIVIGPESSIELGAEFSATIEPIVACCSDNIIPVIPDGSGITFEVCTGGGSQLCLGFNCADNFTVSIFNVLAQLVHQGSGTVGDNVACIWDGLNAASGFYTAEVTVSNGTQSQSLTYTIQLISVNCKMGGSSDITINEVKPDSIQKESEISDGINALTLLVYPNPANNRATIEYTIPRSNKITLYVTNSFGQEVVRLIDNQSVKEGNYTTSFDATYLSSGIYYYTINFGEDSRTKKLILIK